MKLVTLHQFGICIAIAGVTTSIMATTTLIAKSASIETFLVVLSASLVVSCLTRLGPPARRRWRFERKSAPPVR